jgi:hypothetical protein
MMMTGGVFGLQGFRLTTQIPASVSKQKSTLARPPQHNGASPAEAQALEDEGTAAPSPKPIPAERSPSIIRLFVVVTCALL